MKVYNSLTQIPTLKAPVSLSIGVFDGVHLGHTLLLEKVKEHRGTSVVLTFINHPLELLKKEIAPPLLTTEKEKAALLSNTGIDAVILLPFSRDIAEMTYQMFLSEIHKALPFQHLYIGGNDAIGKDRKGTMEALTAFGPKLHFVAHSIPKLMKDDRIVSSSWIRECLRNGDLVKASRLLGREVSLSRVRAELIKPGKYLVRVLEDGERVFTEQEITIEEGKAFETENPSMITFLKVVE